MDVKLIITQDRLLQLTGITNGKRLLVNLFYY